MLPNQDESPSEERINFESKTNRIVSSKKMMNRARSAGKPDVLPS